MSTKKPRRKIVHVRPGELPPIDSPQAAAMFDAAWRKGAIPAKDLLAKFLGVELPHSGAPINTKALGLRVDDPAFAAYHAAQLRKADARRRALGLPA